MPSSQSYNTSSVLSEAMYILSGTAGVEGQTLGQVLADIDAGRIRHPYFNTNHPNYEANRAQLNQLIAAANNYDIASLYIRDTSWSAGHGSNYSTGHGHMNAATFEAQNGDIHIAHRGTGNGNWGFNATSALGNDSSLIQSLALQYAERTIAAHGGNGNIFLTGHSQGSNNAEYVFMFLPAETRERVQYVIGFDGPGHNFETIARARTIDSNFDTSRERVFGFNGQNDPVHVLGEYHLSPSSNTFYVYCFADSLKGIHILSDNWTPDGRLATSYENGVLTCAGQGPVAAFANDLMNNVMRLPSEYRYDAGRLIMGMVDAAVTDSIDFEMPALRDIGLLLRTLPPTITLTILANPVQFFSALHELGVPPLITALVAVNPVGALVLTMGITAIAVLVGARIELLHQIIDFVADIARTAGAMLSQGGQFLLNTLDSFRETINNFAQWLGNIFASRQSSAAGFVSSGDFTLRFDLLNNAYQTFTAASNDLNELSSMLRAQASRLSGQSGFGISGIQRSINNLARDLDRLGDDVSSIAQFTTTLNEITQRYENLAFGELASGTG